LKSEQKKRKSITAMKIETKDYHYSCYDGCCDEYGTILYIDGKEVEDRRFCGNWEAYQYVLEEVLGHEVDEIYDEDDYEN
jgi:hypothetical protein